MASQVPFPAFISFCRTRDPRARVLIGGLAAALLYGTTGSLFNRRVVSRPSGKNFTPLQGQREDGSPLLTFSETSHPGNSPCRDISHMSKKRNSAYLMNRKGRQSPESNGPQQTPAAILRRSNADKLIRFPVPTKRSDSIVVQCAAQEDAKTLDPPTTGGKKNQEIFVWGSRAAFPGGAPTDVMRPTEVTWFAEHSSPWSKLSFGPNFGVAVNAQGEAAIWGSFRKSGSEPIEVASEENRNDDLCFTGPFLLSLPFHVLDAQCSAVEIFFLASDGRVFVLDDLPSLLQNVFCKTAGSQQSAKRVDSEQKPQHGKHAEESPKWRSEMALTIPAYRGLTVSEQGGITVASVEGVSQLEGLPPSSHPSSSGCRLSRWLRTCLTFAIGGFFEDRVVKMSIGNSHAAFVTKNGALYCCGSNDFGQCGVKPKASDDASLHVSMTKVDFSGCAPRREGDNREPFIVEVSCGLRHTVCLCKDGQAYTFGDDSKIQLGLGDTRSNQQEVAGTTYMERARGNTFTSPKAASYFYADRHIQPSPVAVMPPTGVPGVQNCVASKVEAGDDFTLVLYEDVHQGYSDELLKRNSLVCCGETARGQCGRTLQQQQQVSAPVVFPRSASTVVSPSTPGARAASSRYVSGPSSVFRVETLSCGSQHCLALMASKQVVGWGFNAHGQVGTGPKVKGTISPPKTICLDANPGPVNSNVGSLSHMSMGTGPQEPDRKAEQARATQVKGSEGGRLHPPLPRYLRKREDRVFEVSNVFCKFDSSGIIRVAAS
ncbi:regulator of chromosome condensation repeat-containing protein [Cystoisospora suis]|uniref:Regulator of chromosome condensation repeat-containing protein n=1 Tax=Cystoisospora suis TaxID=483139 RepID=A0A2C6L1H4_9APIC|nr:regulator of chromosome condensation repeat-containing protein [Cystoisospora suis]